MANCSLFFTHVFRKDLYLLVLKLIIKIFLNYLFVLLSYSVVNERSAVLRLRVISASILSPLPYAFFDSMWNVKLSEPLKSTLNPFFSSRDCGWWAQVDSNHRPLGYQPSALAS